MKNSLGCGKRVRMNTLTGFICGVPDAWGHEQYCEECMRKLRKKWIEEELKEKSNERRKK